MTKKDLQDKLTELGIEFNKSMKKAELEALLPQEEVTEATSETPEEVKQPKVEVKSTAVENPYNKKLEHLFVIKDHSDRSEVFRKNGDFVRGYSKEVHGSKYRELARKYVETNTYRLRGFVLKA